MIQAQQGSTQIWVPKRALNEPYGTKTKPQVLKRQQKRQKATRRAPQRATHSSKAIKEGKQKP